jgi:hypothetical protein
VNTHPSEGFWPLFFFSFFNLVYRSEIASNGSNIHMLETVLAGAFRKIADPYDLLKVFLRLQSEMNSITFSMILQEKGSRSAASAQLTDVITVAGKIGTNIFWRRSYLLTYFLRKERKKIPLRFSCSLHRCIFSVGAPACCDGNLADRSGSNIYNLQGTFFPL